MWRCCCFAQNIQDLLADGKTLFERRYNTPFRGPTIIPIGAEIFCHPISTEHKTKRDQFSSRICFERVERLDRRSTCGGCRRIDSQHCFRSQKIQRQRIGNHQKVGEQITLLCASGFGALIDLFSGGAGDSNLKVSQTQGRRWTKMTHF